MPIDERVSPRLAVSTVIFALHDFGEGTRLALPLVRRVRNPFEGAWALPGGPLALHAGLEEAASSTLEETTGLEPRYLEQLYAFGNPDRSPDESARTVSIVYWALVQQAEAAALRSDPNVAWYPVDSLPELAFDHREIIDYALWRLRTKLEYSSVARLLLGERFTLRELREVYEIILQRALDPANFRRQYETGGQLIATEEFRTGGRHRPARLYRFAADAAPADPAPQNASEPPAAAPSPAAGPSLTTPIDPRSQS